jgi:mevalonate kinase
MTNTTKTNGNGEQARREQEFAQWLAKQSTERDEAASEAKHLKAQSTGLLTKIDVLEAQLANETSKTKTAELIRDEAVARRAELEALMKTIQAALRAFHISHEPLLREIPEKDSPTIDGA